MESSDPARPNADMVIKLLGIVLSSKDCDKLRFLNLLNDNNEPAVK